MIAATKRGGVWQFPIGDLYASVEWNAYKPPPGFVGEWWLDPHQSGAAKWWLETHRFGDGILYVPVYGDERGTKAWRLLERAERLTKLQIEQFHNFNRLAVAPILQRYEPMFWSEAWSVAKQYGLPHKVIGTMARDALAGFVCGDLFNAGIAKTMEMVGSGYDPAAGFTVGVFVRARVRQAMQAHMRESAAPTRL